MNAVKRHYRIWKFYCNDKTAIKYLFLCEHNINNPSETIGIESISDNNT